MLPLLIFIVSFEGALYSRLDKIRTDSGQNELLEVIVHMKNQPDLSKLPAIFTRSNKVEYLKEFAEKDQKELLDILSNFSERIFELKTYWIFNGFYLKATRDVIEVIIKHPKVSHITPNGILYLEKNDIHKYGARSGGYNISIIKVDSCWAEGFDGTGVIIGNIDSGVDTTHPALQGKWYPGGWYDAVNGLPGPYDDNGHGTFTMGIICGGDGNGPFVDDIGVAPGAKYIIAKAFDSMGTATYDALHSCFQWFATQNTKILNNPWNEAATTSLLFWNDCLNLRDLGILLVFRGGALISGEMRTPANFPIVIGIGATDSLDSITSYSGHGPAPNQIPWNDSLYWFRRDWNLIKPDIVAPGYHIRSSTRGGGYDIGNGVSWAAAHVSGACAILLQKDSTLTAADLYNILLNNADHPPQGNPYPNNNYGWGRLNIHSALHSFSVEEDRAQQENLFQLSVYPNPFKDETMITFQGLEAKGDAVLNIYDVNGRLVRRFHHSAAHQGSGVQRFSQTRWNGIDERGNRLSCGVYFVELRQVGKLILHKVVITR